MITTQTGDGGLTGLPTLLTLLGEQPMPDAVSEAVVTLLSRGIGATACTAYIVDGRSLRIVGSHGSGDSELVGVDPIPVDADLSICRTVREAEIVIGIGHPAVLEPEDPTDEASHSSSSAGEVGSVAAVPVVAAGVAVGAFAVACDAHRAWSARDLQFLDAVASALALWLAHPRTGLITQAAGAPPAAPLTPRQCAILVLVAEGRTTDAIGAALGYSSSTVKQDIGRAMKSLGAPSREAAVTRARELGLCHGTAP